MGLKLSLPGLIIGMKNGETQSLEQVQAFPEGSGEVHFQAKDLRELYEWVKREAKAC